MITKDIPLIVFTLLCQLSVGMLLLYNLVIFLPTFRNKNRFPAHFKTIPILALSFAMLAALVSLLHLGQPQRALHTLENLSTSWLSREILTLIAYLFFTVLFTLFISLMEGWKRLMLIFLNLATAAGIILIFTMSRIYSSLPIPAWHPLFTLLSFIGTSLSMGGVLLLLLQIRHGSWSGQRSLSWIIGIVLLLEIIFIPIFFTYLDRNSHASQLSLKFLLDDYNLIFYFRLAFQILALVLVILSILNLKSDTGENKKLFWPVIGATFCIFLFELLGRGLFYAIEFPFGSL